MYIALTPRRVLVLAAIIAAGAAAWGIYALIDTDSKRIGRTVDAAARAVEKGDSAALRAVLDNDCRVSGMSIAQFMPWYESIRASLPVKKVSQYDRAIVFDPKDPARATVSLMAIIVLDRQTAPQQRVDWRLEMKKQDKDAWKIASARAFMPPPAGTEIPLRAAYEWLYH